MRGEHSRSSLSVSVAMESSPHARGTLRARTEGHRSQGIIPACAGNTRDAPETFTCDWDHPRMRGEHTVKAAIAIRFKGSSPHARGTLRLRIFLLDANGIIPACAGNTAVQIYVLDADRDHPRMRGEHRIRRNPSKCPAGSSPHARGTRWPCDLSRCCCGIIPACAGNTLALWLVPLLLWDHPRMRGEHDTSRTHTIPIWGSSPHARGTLVRRVDHDGLAGIIPACAGNTPTA